MSPSKLLISSIPHPTLHLAQFPAGLLTAKRDFFVRPTEVVARELLGAWFVRRIPGTLYGARIVEVEAYLGETDAAAHSYRGRRTARVEPMYLAGGHLYVFLVYGRYSCANIVTREPGVPQAVLIRAAEPPGGGDPKLLAGPAKFCRALAIDRDLSGVDLITDSAFDIYPDPQPDHAIVTSPRIGVDYAGEAAEWLLRFYLKDSSAVSGVSGKKRGR